MIRIGSDFSGVGSFNQALIRLGIEYDELFACDMDKYARQTFEFNFGSPKYYPKDVYEREIPKDSLDVYMTSPPCQAFSLAGKRKGKDDKRGILFFNSLEFIQENKPRYFIFENVKGLLSHDKVDKAAVYGRTFQEWINYLGGKSVNGIHTFFPYEDSVPYHIYFQVLNAKHYGIPQNRERVFIIGIRDDADNDFQFPKPFPLEKRLKDVLETEVDEKYFLSDTAINHLVSHKEKHDEKGTGFGVELKSENDIASTLRANAALCPTDNHIISTELNQVGSLYENNADALTTVQKDNVVIISSNTKKGYDEAEEEEDSINFSVPSSETRRGRVGKGVAQTLDTQCNQGIATKQWIKGGLQENQPQQTDGISPCLVSAMGMGGGHTPIHNYQQRIRRLTPKECFRLMDFNEDFKWDVSDSQAYKQAGNSICVGVMVELVKKLKL